MKKTIIRILPRPLAHATITFGKAVKRFLRSVNRAFRYGTKPYTITTQGPATSFKMVINPFQNGTVDETLSKTSTWEPEVGQVILTELKHPHSVFLDIGANIGFHTLSAAAALGDQVTIHAFEPIPRLCNQITQSLHENKFTNVSVHNVGLGLTSEVRTLYLRSDNIGGSGTTPFAQLNLAPISSTITVPFTTLDEFGHNLKNLTLIKIDVEGHEFEVLKGGAGLLRKFHPTIIMEFSPMFYRLDYPTKSDDFLVFLDSLHYQTYKLDGTKLDLKTWLKENPHSSQLDIVCK